MCFCKAQICKCAEQCLLFLFFLEQANLQKIHEYLPNTFKFNSKNIPIFSRNTLNQFKIFWALGQEFQCKNEIELFFQSIHLEGELYQIFIFLDKVNFQKDFFQTKIVSKILQQQQYQQITTLILYDCNQKFDSKEIYHLKYRFNSIITSEIGIKLKSTILKISNQQIQNTVRSIIPQKTPIIQQDYSIKVQIQRFQQSLQTLKQKDEKKYSIEYVDKLISLLHNSRQNSFQISKIDQNTSTYKNAVIMKFNQEVLINLSDFTEEILDRIQKIIIKNQNHIGKCINCNSFAYQSLNQEFSFVNTFISSQCLCIQNIQYVDEKQQSQIYQCTQNQIEILISLLRHQFSIKYILQKFQQKTQDTYIIEEKNYYKQLMQNLQQAQENLKILKLKSQQLKSQKEQIQNENEVLIQRRDKVKYQIKKVEEQLEYYECKQKQLDDDDVDNQLSTYYNGK